jgi:glutathione S-transferase
VLYGQRSGGPPLDSPRHALSDWSARLSGRSAFAEVAAEIAAANRELSTPVEGAYGDCR